MRSKPRRDHSVRNANNEYLGRFSPYGNFEYHIMILWVEDVFNDLSVLFLCIWINHRCNNSLVKAFKGEVIGLKLPKEMRKDSVFGLRTCDKRHRGFISNHHRCLASIAKLKAFNERKRSSQSGPNNAGSVSFKVSEEFLLKTIDDLL
ncbi:UNVERIFIED_CONTAM: hypothetical protein Sindi_2426300 [Sesamum indicum]